MHLYRSYPLGIVLSIVATLLCGGAWVGLALAKNEIYPWMAIVVGLVAGLGMLLGYDDADDWGGLTAALIAIAGVAASHVALFILVLLPKVAEMRDNLIFSGLIMGDETQLGLYMRLMTGPAEFFFLIASFFCAYIFGRKGVPLGD